MVKKMNKRKMMVRGAAVFVTLVAIAVIVRALIRKRRPRVTYGPMHEKDRSRFDYLNQKNRQSDMLCKNMLRFERFADRKLLEDSPHLSVEQQLAMFLHTIGHNLQNRVISAKICRSYGTTSIYFRKGLHAIGELRNDYIRPPSLETPTKIAGNHRFDTYFKDRIGAIDGTHVRAGVIKDAEHSFRGRKAFTTQNVMAAVDFNLCFTYVLAGWEGSAHDVREAYKYHRKWTILKSPAASGSSMKSGFIVWTASMTNTMLGFLADLVAKGKRTSCWGYNPVVRPAQEGPGHTRRLVAKTLQVGRKMKARLQGGLPDGPRRRLRDRRWSETRAVEPPGDGLPKEARRLRDRIDYVV